MKGNGIILVVLAAIGAGLYFALNGRRPAVGPRSGPGPARPPTVMGFSSPGRAPVSGSFSGGGGGAQGGGSGVGINASGLLKGGFEVIKYFLDWVRQSPGSSAPREIPTGIGPHSTEADYQLALQQASEVDPANYDNETADYFANVFPTPNDEFAAPTPYDFQSPTPSYAIHTLPADQQAAYYGENF